MNYTQKNKKNNIVRVIGFMLFFFNIIPVFSQNTSILDTIISYKARNITLSQGLKEISDITGLEFSYNSDLIQSANNIKVNYKDTRLKDILTGIINDSTLTFLQVDKQIIIRKKSSIHQLMSRNSFLEKDEYIQIKGSIYDKLTAEKLAFANIAVLGKSIGTVSNENGDFNIKISDKNLTDILVVSYIGYKNTLIPIRELSLYNNSIYLEEDKYQIQEVIIRTNDPVPILKKALKRIKDNYYTDPYYITSFYREIVKKEEGLASITEAVLKVYKSPYLGLFSDQVSLIKSRKNNYFSSADTVSLKLKGGLYASLYLDIIKNPVNFLDEKDFNKFTYRVEDIVNFDNQPVYVISFSPNQYMGETSFEGTIYINTDNLAIVEARFNITPEAIERYGDNLVVKKAFRTRVKPVSANYVINYRKINNKYFINLARGELDFKVKYKRKLFSTEFKTVFEFASNNIDTVDVERFNRVETIPQNNIFIDENYQYDQQFWGEYNYISPDESIEEALIRIKKQLEKME